jgi:hypothetical protein
MSKTSERVAWLMLGLMTTATTVLTGCGDTGGRSPMPPTMMDGGPPPGDVDGPAPGPRYAGVYATTTPIDFTQNGVLPGVIGPTLTALTELRDHPGQAIVQLVTLAQIPGLSDALAELPTFVRNLLAALLDKLIIDELYENVPVIEQLAAITAGLTDVTKTIELHDLLTVHTPAADGKVLVDLQVREVAFRMLDRRALVRLDGRALAQAHAVLDGSVAPRSTQPAADADLTLAGGTLTLPLGELVLQAAGPLVFAPFGANDLGGALQNLVPCHAGALQIADAVDGWIASETIETVCTTALDLVASAVTRSIGDITLGNIRISDGAAYLLDSSSTHPLIDRQSDRIAQGKWVWAFTVGGTTFKVPSTLQAERIANAQ